MKKLSVVLLALCLTVSVVSYAADYKKAEQDAIKPVNCATAEADIRVLNSEKVHAAQQLVAGVTAIVPVSLVIGLVKGTEGEKIKVATGEYNKMLDKKIAEIKRECGIK